MTGQSQDGATSADGLNCAASAPFRVRVRMLRGLYNHIHFVLLVNLGTMALCVGLLWHQGDRAVLVGWSVLLTLIVLGRLAIAFRFRRAEITPRNLALWSWAFALGTAF